MLLITFLSLLYFIPGSAGILYRISDGRYANLVCGANRRLRINSAYYCSEDNDTNCCHPDFSFLIVSKLCNYHASCIFLVSPFLLVGICPVGSKYLTIDYSCDNTNSPTPRKCSLNEEWVDCRSACPKTCDNINKPFRCAESCVPGCQCAASYVRDPRTGYCIKAKFCYKNDEPNETFSKCNANTQPSCSTSSCQPGYVCRYPLVRNDEGYCVERNKCPS